MQEGIFTQLDRTFDTLKTAFFDGVRGVIRIEGAKQGPTVGLTVCTHGNEIAGLAAAKYILKHKENIRKGTIFIVVNNLQAAERHFKKPSPKNRFIDVDLNRLSEEAMQKDSSMMYEINRAKELMPVWNRFDFAVDIHSTTLDTKPLIIAPAEGLRTEIVHGIPIHTCISNITNVQVGVPAINYYGNRTASYAFGVECGSHKKPESFELAERTTAALLSNLEMLAVKADPQKENYTTYTVFDSILFPNKSYELVRVFKNFEFLKEGTVIARGAEGAVITAPVDCHTLFASRKKPSDLNSEVMFLALPANVCTL